jgi:outer membrane receptor protein involved in Fe transport
MFSYWEDNTFKDLELGVRYERAIGRTALETQVLNRFTHLTVDSVIRRPPEETVYAVGSKVREHIGRIVARFRRDERLTLEASAEGVFNGLSNRSARSVGGVANILPTADVEISERRGEAGAALTWKPNGRYTMDAALKAETSYLVATGTTETERTFTFLKPKLALAWSPDKDTQARIRAEREISQVDFGYLINYQELSGQLIIGNASLRPRRTWVLEAVIERRFWNGGNLQLTARRRQMDDVIDAAPLVIAGGVYSLASNIGKGRATDLIVNVTLPLKRLGLDRAMMKGTVTRTWSRVIDPTTGARRPLSGQSPVMAELHFSQDFPQWKLNWGIDAFYRGRSTLYRPFNTEAIAGWPHVNVFVERRFEPAYTLRLEVQNLPGVHTPQRIEVFSGLRGAAPLSYADEKHLSSGPLAYVRLRRAFE